MSELLLRRSAAGLSFGSIAAESQVGAGEAAPHRLELALVDTPAGFADLERDWNALSAAAGGAGQVFQTYNWCWHWCRHYLGDGTRGPSLAIVTGRRQGRLVLLMPLVVARRAGLRELAWLGEPVSQYGDLLALPEAATAESLLAAWRFVVSRTGADVANLRRVRADAIAAPLLASLATCVTATEDAPYLRLGADRSFSGWEERRQPRARKNRRRQARRLAELGPVVFAEHAAGPTAAALARQAVRLKREALGAKAAISLALADDRFEAFFADAAMGLGRPCGVKVASLTSNGEPAALKILLTAPGACFLHVAVFDPRFEKCGAGALLLEHVVGSCIAARDHTLDLLPPRHEYKLDFADGVVEVSDHALALTGRGWLYARGWLGARRRIKALIEALPVPARRLLARAAG